MSTARQQLAAALKPLLPKDWRIIPYQKNLDALSTTVVMLKLSHLTKLPAAPLSHVRTTWTITVADPSTDIEKAEDALDDEVTSVCLAINQIPGIKWVDATKVTFQDKYLAWDITSELTANNKKG